MIKRTTSWRSTQVRERTTKSQRRVVWISAVAIPAAILALATLFAFLQLGNMPDKVPTHWGMEGADRFGSPMENMAVFVTAGIALIVVGAILGLRVGSSAMTRKMAGAVSVGGAVLMGLLLVGIFLEQQGMTAAQLAASDIDGIIFVALAVAIVAGVITGFLIPSDDPMPTDRSIPPDAPRLKLEASESVMWSERVSAGGAIVVISIVAVIPAVFAIVSKMWSLLLISLILIAALVIFSSFRASISQQGFTCRATLGFPKVEVPLDEIESAEVEFISPMRDFGGYGYRTGTQGAIGFIFRKGDGLIVRRTGGRVVVATVVDAERAVALLNGLIQRDRG